MAAMEMLDTGVALLDLEAEHDEDFLSAVPPAYGACEPSPGVTAFVGQLDPPKIRVVVRKRPLNAKEAERGDEDVIGVSDGANLTVNELKVKVDLTAYTERHLFCFDDVLDTDVTNDQVYRSTVQPLVATVFRNGKATCFAYGQTGSGKTYTMQPLPLRSAADIFKLLADPRFAGLSLFVSCFEIYGGKLYDLLNGRQRLEMREDGRKRVCIVGLREFVVDSVDAIRALIEQSSAVRSTGSTGANDESSRSHSIMQFAIKRTTAEGNAGALVGKISFIDLAGSERGADTYDNDRQTRLEGAEINKSLLALKECIRALDSDARHVPFRGSKLTEVLRDSFVGSEARTVMIANVSPTAASCEHTLNTLRYADRVKELRKDKGARAAGSVTPGPMAGPASAYQGAAVERVKAAPPPEPKAVPYVPPLRQPAPAAAAMQAGNRGPTPSPRKPAASPPLSPGQRSPAPSPRRATSPQPNGRPSRSPLPAARPQLSPRSQQQPARQRDLSPQPAQRRAASPPRYYEGESEEDVVLLAARDELMNTILVEEDQLIAHHRKQIEDTMAVVRQEMNLLGEVDQPGSAIDTYVDKLAAILAHKAEGIRKLQQRLDAFKVKLREEEQLSSTVTQRRSAPGKRR